MKALNGRCFMVPQLDCDLGKLGFMKRSCFVDLFHGGNVVFSVISGNWRPVRSRVCCGSSKFDNGCWSFSGKVKLKAVVFCRVREKCSCNAFVALGLALEQEAVGDELVEEQITGNVISGEAVEEDGRSCNVGGVEGGIVHSRVDSPRENRVRDKKRKRRVDVHGLALKLRSAKTVEDVEEVLKDTEELPHQVYIMIIKGFGVEKMMESAKALVEWLKRKKVTHGFAGPNIYIYNSLLGAAKRSAQYGEAEKIMNDMAREGMNPTIVTYNTLMGIFVDQGETDKALSIFAEIPNPNAVSYYMALSAYRSIRDANGAVSFFAKYSDKFSKEDVQRQKCGGENLENEYVRHENLTLRICYEAMRVWLVDSENFSASVLKLLTHMDKVSIKLNRDDLQRLVWACTRQEHHIVAKDLYIRIRERHSKISLSVCNHVIWLLGKAKKWWAALEVYEDLLDKGPRPDDLSYELIVSHFSFLLITAKRKRIWKWGVWLINKMVDKGIKPETRQWNAVLALCSKASETTAAVQIFERMVDQGEKPTVVSYGTLLSALEKGKLYDEAFRVWNHMIKVGVKPNAYAYTTMVSVHTAQEKLNMVDALIHDMAASGVEPTVITYNAVISACARNGRSSVAYEYFHRMKLHNIAPDRITYDMLVQALGKDGKPKLAYELYLKALSEGLNLSAKTYDAVMDSSPATVDLSALGPRPADPTRKVEIRKYSTK